MVSAAIAKLGVVVVVVVDTH